MMGKVHTNILSFEENQWKYKLKGQWVAFAKTDAWSLYDVLGCDVWRRPTGKKKKYPGQLWSRFEREAISEIWWSDVFLSEKRRRHGQI